MYIAISFVAASNLGTNKIMGDKVIFLWNIVIIKYYLAFHINFKICPQFGDFSASPIKKRL